MSEPREFKVGDVISIDEVRELKEYYTALALDLAYNTDCLVCKLDGFKDIVKLKIVALPEVD